MSLDRLKANTSLGVNDCYNKAEFWKKIYYAVRASLILFAALTSAEALTTIEVLKGTQPYFALLVTIISGYDTWLKPGAKYRAFYVANDEYDQLEQKVDLLSPTDINAAKDAAKEYGEIGARLSKAVTPD